MKKIFRHLKTIFIHKYWVFYYCRRLGITWQGIVHDMSKFSPVEFIESVKYFQGGKSSPIPVAKREQGYSLAWQHHKGRNPHHYEYWTDNYDDGTTCIKMPFKYVLELIADYLAAGKTYNGKDFTIQQEIDWWNSCKDKKAINELTKLEITFLFMMIEKYGLKHIKDNYLFFKRIYEDK